ncbi:hypothetical protein EDC01DRAFT_781393 [Geopyxis carbonaria]|nr:hypothetical protein EDC01DRAFT_781393 [Geopyxis carbonaria]
MVRVERYKNAQGSLDKLTRGNYHAWSTEVIDLLENEFQQAIVLGTKPCPASLPDDHADADTRKIERAEWDKASKAAAKILRGSLCSELRPTTVDSESSAPALWSTLKNRFDPVSNHHGRALVLRQFHAIHQLPDEPVASFISRL